MFARIPIAHLHGGELTEGLIDEAMGIPSRNVRIYILQVMKNIEKESYNLEKILKQYSTSED